MEGIGLYVAFNSLGHIATSLKEEPEFLDWVLFAVGLSPCLLGLQVTALP